MGRARSGRLYIQHALDLLRWRREGITCVGAGAPGASSRPCSWGPRANCFVTALATPFLLVLWWLRIRRRWSVGGEVAHAVSEALRITGVGEEQARNGLHGMF